MGGIACRGGRTAQSAQCLMSCSNYLMSRSVSNEPAHNWVEAQSSHQPFCMAASGQCVCVSGEGMSWTYPRGIWAYNHPLQ